MEPLEVVGWEGVYGTAVCLLLALPLAQLIPGDDEGSFENSFDSMRLIANSGALIALNKQWRPPFSPFRPPRPPRPAHDRELRAPRLVSSQAYPTALDVVATLFYNYFAMCVTQGLSAIHRMLLETMRTLAAWVIGLTLYYAVSDGQYGEKWGRGSFTQLLGFVIMVTGTIVYNRSELAADSEDLDDSSASALDTDLEPETTYQTTPAGSPAPPPLATSALLAPAAGEEGQRREREPLPTAGRRRDPHAHGLHGGSGSHGHGQDAVGSLRRRDSHVGSFPHSLRSGYMLPSSLQRGSPAR
eukprot:tig00020538_g10337.t1